MTLQEVMSELESMGSEQIRKIWANHGATGDFFGVKVGDMKTIQKKVKKNPELASALYKTHNADAMYLAGLICDPGKMSKEELQAWAEKASWYMVGEYTVAWAASESRYGRELALEWISTVEPEYLASIGWSTYGCLLALLPDEQLDMKEIRSLMDRVQKTIHKQSNGRVRYTMNNFVISAGCYVAALTEEAKKTAAKIGKVEVEMGNTACKVPDAAAYIEKVAAMGRIGKKKKTVFC